ncbi:MAG: precorrin-8X methylmutase [Cucumibacter sp.]
MDYLRDPASIYRQSFAIIEREAELTRFAPGERELAIRLIHACGMPDIAAGLVTAPGAVEAGRAALAAGAPIVCDVTMVRQGIVASRLPAGNPVHCGLDDAPASAGTTRSAVGIDSLKAKLPGAIVAIGNAPTALFRLLELLDQGLAPPAMILAFPVGFVGAAESKAALIDDPRGVPFVTLRGRRGGSALAAAAVNALAGVTP